MIACPSCGYETYDASAFCSKCGTKLVAPRALPQERKVVTTLISDLVGFTAMSEAADPEDVDRLLGEYSARARRVIESHGGTVEKFIGDAVVGVFGVPTVHEDDPVRAVRAGLRLTEALEGLTRPDGSPLEARVGVNTGEAVVRLDVDPASGRGFLTGDAVNTAARLQGSAPPMGVVVGSLTHRLTVKAFAYESLPPLRLKGKSGQVRAWLAREPVEHGVVQAEGLSSPMVGRTQELAAFTRPLHRFKDGQGGLLLLTGEAGIGKTRLVEEAHAAALNLGCSWLEGRTLSFGRSISYWPFLEIIQQDASIDSDDSEAERWAKLSGRVTDLFGEQTPEVLPYLAALLGYPVPDEFAERVRHLDAETMGHQVYRASRLYFSRLAQERPLVVVVEDVHWLDASSVALLEHLLPLTMQAPILFCCVARPELDTPLARLQTIGRETYAERLTQIALWPLSADESTTLACNLARLDGLPNTLRAAILEKAEGNPFFVEEIVRSLIDLGGLAPGRGGHYHATERAGDIDIPDTLQGVIMARVDRLDEELKEVLRLASVIGRSFFYRVLAEVDEADRTLDRSLEGLQTRELIRERTRDPELEYIFKHALVQEVTYESILRQRRRELHRRVAKAIAALFPDGLEDFYSLLAYHYTKAEDWQKAQEYLFKAADRAGKIAADAEALDHYERAMDAYTRAFGDRWDPVERAAVERKMGEALFRRGDYEHAHRYLYRALAILGHPFPTTAGAVRRALLVEFLRQVVHRLLPWRRRPARARAVPRIAQERALPYYALAWMDVGADQAQLLLATLRGLNMAESVGLDWAASIALSGIGYACAMVPLPRLARFYLRRGLALAEKTQDPRALGLAYTTTALYWHWRTGDQKAALNYLRRAQDRLGGLGMIREWCTAASDVVDIQLDRGELAEACLLAEEVATVGEEAGDDTTRGSGLTRAGYAASLQGGLREAESRLRAGIEGLVGSQPAVAVMGVGWLAQCLLRQGKVDEGRSVLAEQVEHISVHGLRGYLLRGFRTAQAVVCLAAAEQAQGSARAEALKEAKSACRALRKTAKADICGMVAAYRLRGSYEWLCGRPKKAEAWWRRCLTMAGRLEMPYEGALAELEMGRCLGDRAALESSAATFEAVGALLDLEQARELINGPGLEGIVAAAMPSA